MARMKDAYKEPYHAPELDAAIVAARGKVLSTVAIYHLVARCVGESSVVRLVMCLAACRRGPRLHQAASVLFGRFGVRAPDTEVPVPSILRARAALT